MLKVRINYNNKGPAFFNEAKDFYQKHYVQRCHLLQLENLKSKTKVNNVIF